MTARSLGCATVTVILLLAVMFLLGAFVPWLTGQLVQL